MDNFFRLFRYLATNKHRTDEKNSYNMAFVVLDPVMGLVDSLSRYGQKVYDTGGLAWDDADKITEAIITSHRIELFEHAGQDKHRAVCDLIEEYFTSDEVARLISNLTIIQGQLAIKEAEEAAKFDKVFDNE